MKRLLIILAVCLALMPLLKSNAWGAPVSDIGPVVHSDHDLSVDLWTDRTQDEVYDIGDNMEVYFRANSDCYVTIYSIDTEGHIDVLFPRYPDDGYVFGGMTYRLPDYYDAMDLRLRGPRGVGYLHAAASRHPNAFRLPVHRGRYHLDVAPVAGDPFLAINTINGRLVHRRHLDAVATVSFFVGSRVWYPRYMCYDCHGRTVRFDPYQDACARYSVHLTRHYDYWWGYDYYPASARLSYTGPFWKFELRTIPAYRHRGIRHIDCAYGFGNYYPVRPIKRHVRHVVYRPTRTRTLYTRDFRSVTYRETRSRRSGVDRAGSTSTGGSRGSISNGSSRSIDRSRSNGSSRSIDQSRSNGSSRSIDRSRSNGSSRSIDQSRSNGSSRSIDRSRSSVGGSGSAGTGSRAGSISGRSGLTNSAHSREVSRTQQTASPDRSSTRGSRSTPALRFSSPSSSPNRSRSVTSPSSSSRSRSATRSASSSSRSRSETRSTSSTSRSRSTTRSASSTSRRGSSTSRDRSGSDERRMSIGGRSGGSRSSATGRTRSR